MTPRVLLLGASGFLGSHLAARLPESFLTFAPLPRAAVKPKHAPGPHWLASSVEAGDEASLRRVFDEASPDVVVNAIGLRVGSRDELHETNALFPRRLAALAESRGVRAIHISTDGVFSGARGAYVEADPPDPTDEYGRSKLAGELSAPHLTIRTSFFGRTSRGTGLLEWLITQRNRTVEGYVDYRFSGMAVALLADLIAWAAATPGLSGLYHVGGEPLTKFDLLKAAGDQLRLDVRVIPTRRGAIDRTLVSDRFFAAAGRSQPSLADSLAMLSACGTCLPN